MASLARTALVPTILRSAVPWAGGSAVGHADSASARATAQRHVMCAGIARSYHNHSNAKKTTATSVTWDFRSDTVTRPTEGMYKAMMEAPVGDDVFGEDPTVVALEERVADLCGHERGLFCASGSMTNQLGLRAHLGALESVICDFRAHIFRYECGGVGYHSQAAVVPLKVDVPTGPKHLTAEDIEANIFPEDVHYAVTKGVSLENTYNGHVFPFEEIKRIRDLCDRKGLFLHVDGARLWNASIASGVSLREYGALFHSLSLCLSKGLGAPVGSILVGSAKFIERARHFRKLFGGGWRQAGILAAAGSYAIDHHWPRMAEDHANARVLADGLRSLGFVVMNRVDTNAVFARPGDAVGMSMAEIVAHMSAHGVLMSDRGANMTRMLVHHQTPRQAIDGTLALLADAIEAAAKRGQRTGGASA